MDNKIDYSQGMLLDAQQMRLIVMALYMLEMTIKDRLWDDLWGVGEPEAQEHCVKHAQEMINKFPPERQHWLWYDPKFDITTSVDILWDNGSETLVYDLEAEGFFVAKMTDLTNPTKKAKETD